MAMVDSQSALRSFRFTDAAYSAFVVFCYFALVKGKSAFAVLLLNSAGAIAWLVALIALITVDLVALLAEAMEPVFSRFDSREKGGRLDLLASGALFFSANGHQKGSSDEAT